MCVDHGLTLSWCESSEGEHTDLGCDVRPVSLDALLLDGTSKSSSHVIHSLADCNELFLPLLEVGRVVEDSCSNSSTMLWRRRVVSSDNDLGLAHDSCSIALVSAEEVESSCSLTIETHDLGE